MCSLMTRCGGWLQMLQLLAETVIDEDNATFIGEGPFNLNIGAISCVLTS